MSIITHDTLGVVGMTSISKVLANPQQATWYLRKKTIGRARNAWLLLQNGQWDAFKGYLWSQLFDTNPYLEKRIRDAEDGVIEVDVFGLQILVDVNDEGLGHDLIKYGFREPLTTRVYRSELSSFQPTTEGIGVLDIGANIGYYALLAADILGDRATIHAVEPAPANIRLLKKNVESNGFSNITIHRGAMGSTTGSANLKLATHSNRHRMTASNLSNSNLSTSKTIETSVWTVEDFIDEHGIDPIDVDVIRMDVEGFETEIFKGMDSILRSNSSLLINVELHPGEMVDRTELYPLIDSLADGGFEIVSVNGGTVNADIKDFESLKSFPAHWYELTVKR